MDSDQASELCLNQKVCNKKYEVCNGDGTYSGWEPGSGGGGQEVAGDSHTRYPPYGSHQPLWSNSQKPAREVEDNTILVFPYNLSVNDGIDKELCSLRYIQVDDIIDKLSTMGPGTQMAKVDIESAYRLVPVHSSDRHRFNGSSKRVEDSLIKTLGRWESLAYFLYFQVPRERLEDLSVVLAKWGWCPRPEFCHWTRIYLFLFTIINNASLGFAVKDLPSRANTRLGVRIDCLVYSPKLPLMLDKMG